MKLPKGWFEAKSDEGHTYYFNDDTGVSVWTHPALEPYKQLYANAKRKAQATAAAASSSSSNNYNNISSSASINSSGRINPPFAVVIRAWYSNMSMSSRLLAR